MDVLLQRVTQQAVQYAIRSGITITTGYAIKECSRLLKQAPKSRERDELMQLQQRLESKIRVVAPSIDMIELIAARGNTSLESALSLCKTLRYDIQKLGQRLDQAAQQEQHLNARGCKGGGGARDDADRELVAIIDHIKLLLGRIEDAVPLINLAIVTSGVNLSTNLSGTISPSRLLQASTFLTQTDSRFTKSPTTRHQVGPTYLVKLYMLFAGHSHREPGRETTWQEVLHKTHVKLWRVPLDDLYALPGEVLHPPTCEASSIPAEAKASEFAYQLSFVEDHDDTRLHTYEEGDPKPGLFDGVAEAGIRDVVPIHEISKIFYADTGKILNITGEDEVNYPCLLLKRDVHAEPPRRMMKSSRSRTPSVGSESEQEDDEYDQSHIDQQIERESTPMTQTSPSVENVTGAHSWRLPPSFDPEWMALQVYTEEDDSDSDDENDDCPEPSRSASFDPGLSSALAHLTLTFSPSKRSGPPIKTTLSLLEMLMKLSALQQFRQESHLAIEDELLNFFLEDSGTAGAGADKQHRQQVRHAAIQRVGFDPYDESPIKRRGEAYIRGAAVVYHQTPSRSPTPDLTSDVHRGPLHSKFAGPATPVGTQKTRAAAIRTQNENRSRSPLHATHAANGEED
ncbi:hypothetical protein CERZMDRAFT_114345 [Cercospora zeae-maydis SCOH1-5]|uniref:Ran-binding-domain-containing protein n=1 Tax=Cercospora zeae-maydis SCOH1-5 TaxID=717836 RepID=A0A6A6F5X4_9PEZI|nr:hypothetical protein CERZMDRAFT_114345 [Cercospora zeae-maydis SCOH1-5]